MNALGYSGTSWRKSILTSVLILIALSGLLLGQNTPAKDDAEADRLIQEATFALRAGKAEEALGLANRVVTVAPREPRAYLLRGSVYAAQRRHQEAIADFDVCIRLDPKFAEAWQRRGEEHFKRTEIEASLLDFDEFLKLRPTARPGHWQRGISLYYGGKFKEGAEQFLAGERVFADDVENAVWHYLCTARFLGSEKARQSLLRIGKDRRVPLMVVYALFAGRAKPEDVWAAVRDGGPAGPELRKRQFYAHLYLGLYFDATGDTKKALEHLSQAADDQGIGGYMGDVARVHRQLLLIKATKPGSDQTDR
jgi:lipoprotein NlpI